MMHITDPLDVEEEDIPLERVLLMQLLSTYELMGGDIDALLTEMENCRETFVLEVQTLH